jgi:hypothetical protein
MVEVCARNVTIHWKSRLLAWFAQKYEKNKSYRFADGGFPKRTPLGSPRQSRPKCSPFCPEHATSSPQRAPVATSGASQGFQRPLASTNTVCIFFLPLGHEVTAICALRHGDLVGDMGTCTLPALCLKHIEAWIGPYVRSDSWRSQSEQARWRLLGVFP